MKLTWFENTAFRIHIGGQVIVIDAEAAPGNVDAAELVSGADQVIGFGGNLPVGDLHGWKPRARERLLDAGDQPRLPQIWSAGKGVVLIDADDEMPLLLVSDSVPEMGRWVDKSVVVLVGAALAERGAALVQQAIPRLVALAGRDEELDLAFQDLPPKLDGAGLLALQPGLAVEV